MGHVGSSSRTRYRTQTPFTGSRVLATGPPGKSPVLCLEMDAGYTSMCSVGENSLRTCALSNVSIIFNTSFPLIPHTATTYWQIRDLNFKTFVFHLSDWQLSELLRVFETNPFILWDVSTTQKSHFRRQLSSVSEKTPVHPTPVLLPGESQGQGSLVGCSPWGR